jgi:hypothetical protein
MYDVTILSGKVRGNQIQDVRCKLMNPIKHGARGWYGNFDIQGVGVVRVYLPHENAILMHKKTQSSSDLDEALTDQQISERIEDRMKILRELTTGVGSGDILSLIVSGAPGMGKSVGIQKILDESKHTHGIEYNKISGNIVSGYQLYQTLYENSEENSVLVLDDCDGLLFDITCLNMLKAALESGGKPRIVDYHSDSVVHLGIPKSFEFRGSIIFITNINFQQEIAKEKNISKHLRALVDRSLYLDLTIHTRREIWCRIHTMVTKHDMLGKFSFDSYIIDQILDYVKVRQDDFFPNLSLRTVVQLAQFVKTTPNGWRRLSEALQMRNK